MNKLILIDAYALIYRSYYALIRSPRINSKGLNTSAVMGFVNTLWEVIQKEKPTHVAVAFDHGRTFRHDAYPPYKAQREETPEDIKLSVPIIKQILEAWHIPCLQADGYEADDVIGAIAKSAPCDIVYMLTPDKDYAQLVGDNVYMYKPRHGGGYDILGEPEICEKYTISSAKNVIDILALMGDSADNFPGCPGVGEKTAIKLIKEFGDCENIIANANNIKGALGKKVQEHIEDIRISRFLAEIKTDIPGISDNAEEMLSQMTLQLPDAEQLASLFDELEFRQLANKILTTLFPDSPTLVSRFSSAGGKVTSTSNGASSGRNGKSSSANDEDDEWIEERKVVGYNLFGEPEYEVRKVKKIKVVNESKEDLSSVQNNLSVVGSNADEGQGMNFYAKEIRLSDVPHEYKLIDNLADTSKLCDFLLTNGIVCFDTETTSKHAIDAELVGMSFCAETHKAFYVSISGKMAEAAEAMRPFFESEEIVKVGQNMKYDIEVLAHYDIEVRGVKRDTMVAHYLLNPELRHGMDYMAETMLDGYRTIHYDDVVERGKTMADISPALITDYACEDADITLQLWHILEQQLKETEGLWQLFEDIEMPLVDVLADMEQAGVRIKSETLSEVSKLFTERMNEHEKKIYLLAGHEFNISSPRQVGAVLFDEMKVMAKPKKTKTGQYVTSEEVLQTLAKDHPIVSEILEYRGLKKLIGTYLDALPKLVNPKTGHIHTSFNQCVTATGRLSSSDPNLQNIPVRGEDGKEIRKCFVADEGCLFFSADYSQIELRVMAHLSQDEEMINSFKEGRDVHAATAANVYHKEHQEVTRDERTKAKRANFGIIYGISAWGLSQSLEIDRKEAKALMDGFFETFPKVKDYMDESVAKVKTEAQERCDSNGGSPLFNYGYARTLLHRRRKLDNINSGNATVRSFDERNAINAPIQGTAADIIKIAMVRIHKRFKSEGLRSKMILQVHDELNFSVVPEEKENVERIVLEEMQNAFPLSVPLIADSGWGDNWLEAH